MIYFIIKTKKIKNKYISYNNNKILLLLLYEKMLRYLFRSNINNNLYNLNNNFIYTKSSFIYNNKKNNHLKNFSIIPKKISNQYDYNVLNYKSKFIDETHNHDNNDKDKYIRLIIPSMIIMYVVTNSF